MSKTLRFVDYIYEERSTIPAERLLYDFDTISYCIA